MRPSILTKPVTVAALLAAAGLAVLNWTLLWQPVDISAIAPPAITAPAAASGGAELARPFEATTPKDFAETVARPLFWASRRPQPPAPPPAAPISEVQPEIKPVVAPVKPSEVKPSEVKPGGLVPAEAEVATVAFRLNGVMDDGRNKKRALLAWPEQPGGRWLAVGAEVDGWRVTRISQDAVRVQAGRRHQDIKLVGLSRP